MTKVAIVTDSGSDLPPLIARLPDVHIVPLYVNLDGETRKDGVDLASAELYRLMTTEDAVVRTSQPSPGDFRDAFEKALETCDQVVCPTLSSAISGTFQSARLAREEMAERENIHIVDTRLASLGLGLSVITAVKLRERGDTAAAIAGHLEMLDIEAYFTVENLKYLERGGRLSRTSAAMGQLLNIKPVLAMSRATEGQIQSLDRVRGRAKSIRFLIDRTVAALTPNFDGLIGVSHSDSLDEAEKLALDLRNLFPKAEQYVSEIGSAIGAHTGPGTLAVFYVRKQN